MKGRGLVKVTGILFIIFGGLGLLSNIPSLVNGTAFGSVASILSAIGCLLMLITGIVGVSSSSEAERGTMIIGFGVLLAAITVVSFIVNIAGVSLDAIIEQTLETSPYTADLGGDTEMVTNLVKGFAYIFIGIGPLVTLILSVLYIIGGVKLRAYNIAENARYDGE